MDIVTKNLMKNFQDEESLPEDISEATLFEHFANFCVVSKEYSEEFSLEDIHTGESSDVGFDGIAITVNGTLINSVEEIEDMAIANKYIETDFIFIQSKTSSNFDGADIGNFLFGVRDIFNPNPRLPRNERVESKLKLINEIYKKSVLFKRGNPTCKLYYVTTGKWQNDPYLITKVNSDIELLENLNIFKGVTFHPVDASQIQKLYSYAKNSISQTIDFENKVTVPEIKGIKEAYIGILPLSELLKLITDESGAILRGLFYDNVRDFQGDNEVNLEIEQTIQSNDRDLFVLLNNGVTIVCDTINKTANKFNVEAYQIVNGCQTSHVIYNNKEHITPTMFVPVRLIVSEEDEVKNKVIKATNRQTQVKNEELEALTDFQKTLEQFYAAQPEEYRLYYERRSQQYRATAGIDKIRIVSIPSQIRSFSSMFLDEPHRAGRYYGTLLSMVKNKIFTPGHEPMAYYVSAYANFKLEQLMRRKHIDSKYRPFRYHMLMILRLQTLGKQFPEIKSNKFKRECSVIKELLWDNSRVIQAFQQTCDAIDAAISGNYDRDNAKNSRLVNDILSLY
jgi:hypothetical protein